jgi:hypothetical protein
MVDGLGMEAFQSTGTHGFDCPLEGRKEKPSKKISRPRKEA